MPTTALAPLAPLVTPEIPVVETDRDHFAKNRDLVTTALRANGDRQITGTIRIGPPDDPTAGVCFVGCALEVIE
ncbi:MAG: hypothetical protein JWM87_793 [Candidatus Eremiobacteraeota bacterium]|nr:hypothetical protein [Candidatus Eremiobacteraeota bacterium]